MGNDELYHKLLSELYFNRAVMSFMAAVLLFSTIGKRDVVAYFGLYALVCLIKSALEYVRGDG